MEEQDESRNVTVPGFFMFSYPANGLARFVLLDSLHNMR